MSACTVLETVKMNAETDNTRIYYVLLRMIILFTVTTKEIVGDRGCGHFSLSMDGNLDQGAVGLAYGFPL